MIGPVVTMVIAVRSMVIWLSIGDWLVVIPPQVIETISAVDRDEPQTGHRFFFSLLSAEEGGAANFTLRDNKDNTASVVTRRSGFLRRERPLHPLRVLISDAGAPALSSTGTLAVRVCACDAAGRRSLCGEESSLLLAAGLSPAAFLSILACLLILLGEGNPRRPPGGAVGETLGR
ncbi:Cadherin-7 [Merluccius polli]|uniref:Cadherin-7 n=1 Tax=Merluccius polli TaxID=89951 RepID=A0AA47NPI0_MERPO|nr:Cadherin-7 [Merluccius polli]